MRYMITEIADDGSEMSIRWFVVATDEREASQKHTDHCVANGYQPPSIRINEAPL
jgi:hypothetical protein